ncbi:MAG: hypothetical protein FWE22_03790 [Firmicutes bacterium]|nr:hypothetical protein [Bacillota bacterium]
MNNNNFNEHGYEDIEKWSYSQNDEKNKGGFFKKLLKGKEENRPSSDVEFSKDYKNDDERRMNEISDNQPYHNTGTYSMVPNFDEAKDEDGVVNASGS